MNNDLHLHSKSLISFASMIPKYLRLVIWQIIKSRLWYLVLVFTFILLIVRPLSQRKYDVIQNPDQSRYSGVAQYTNEEPILTVAGTQTIYLENVILDCMKTTGAIGGENLNDVINQNEDYELLKMEDGFIRISSIPKIDLSQIGSLNHNVLQIAKLLKSGNQSIPRSHRTGFYQDRTVFMVNRVEYVNLYHTMTDWFNTFLVMKHLKLEPHKVHILLTDGHPMGSLDNVWDQLFDHSVSRIGAYKSSVAERPDLVRILPLMSNGHLYIGKLAIVPYGYDSPISRHNDNEVSHIEDFRTYFLRSYGVNLSSETKCVVNILIIWRHDYVAHPRNPKGLVSRKIENEQELLEALNSLKMKAKITALQIDQLSMQDQITLIATTDILVGMHGAGLTHAIFLPTGSSLIEIVPGYCCASLKHFEAISHWRRLDYFRLNVPSSDDVSSYSSKVNVNRFVDIVKQKWKLQQDRKLRKCALDRQ